MAKRPNVLKASIVKVDKAGKVVSGKEMKCQFNPTDFEMSRTIESSESPSPEFFNEGARIRWNRKDYQGAIQDWEKAIQLAPRRASLYAQTGEAYIKLGDWRQALKYYQKAVKLEPKNSRYTNRYLELKGESS